MPSLETPLNSPIRSLYYRDYEIIKIYYKYTIKFYYYATIKVIECISKLNQKSNVSMNFPIEDNDELSNDKNNILRTAYKTSSVCVITGAAGTGKTRLIHEYIKLNADKRILCLTTTNTAKNNLKGEYGNNVIYKNISENWMQSENYDFI